MTREGAHPGAGWHTARWLNEPGDWHAAGSDSLTVSAEPGTDFWRLTHDGAVRDTGHFLGQPIGGDATATVAVRGDYRHQYDQAGLMLRVDEARWMKTGVEWVDGLPYASVVVTNNSSDWSLVMAPNREVMWFRVRRIGTTVEVSISGDGVTFALFRQFSFAEGAASIGPFCCSVADGFAATFSEFRLEV